MKILLDYFKNLSFRKKLVLSYIIIIIIPVIVLGVYSYNKSKFYLQDQVKRDVNYSISQRIEELNYNFKRYNDVINVIIFNQKVKKILSYKDSITFEEMDGLNNYVEPMLYNLMLMNRDVKKVTIYTEDGKPVSGDFVQPNESVKNNDWYKISLSNNKTNWWFRDNQLFVSRNIIDTTNQNKEIGMLCLKLDYKSAFDDILKINTSNYGFIITDTNNNILFSKDTSNNKVDEDFLNKIVNSKQNELQVDMENYIIVNAKLTDANFNLYYYVPTNALTIDSKSIINATATIIIVCLILLTILIWLFSKTFVDRIIKLNNKMSIVENGELDIEVSSQSKDEIGRLYNSFGNMLKTINNLIKEVYESKIVQREAELKALQAQINPHFLYNTFSVINWKAKMIGANDISDITQKLSKFYRTTLNNGENVISIKDEMANIQAYIDIQLVMHDNNFEVTYELANEIFEYYMPNLILQPIVENAIKHGIDLLENKKGSLQVKGKINEEEIEFIISDNGIGISENVLSEILIKHTKGYGLKNVQDRIVLFFGEQYGLSIESSIKEGTSIKVRIAKYLKANK